MLPLIRKAFRENDSQFLTKACSFIERFLLSGDTYAENVAIIGILEGVKATEDVSSVRLFLGPKSLMYFDNPTF